MPNPTTTERELTVSEIKDQIKAFEGTSRELQRRFGPMLREMAIRHMRDSNDPAAVNIRAMYPSSRDEKMDEPEEFSAYLDKQKATGQPGTEKELTALGELFGVNIDITPIENGKLGNRYAWYNGADASILGNPTPPRVHVHNNSNKVHWYHKTYGGTLGDGNCLFNAFAEALGDLFGAKLVKESKETSTQTKQIQSISQEYAALEKLEANTAKGESDDEFAFRLQKEEARLAGAGYESIANAKSVGDLQGNETYKNLYAEYQSPVMHSSVSMFGTKNPVNTAKSQSFLSRFSDFLGLSKAEQSDPSAAVFPPTA